MTRRDFLGNTLAALGFAALPGGFLFAAPPGWKRGGKPNLVFGVVSDTHKYRDGDVDCDGGGCRGRSQI